MVSFDFIDKLKTTEVFATWFVFHSHSPSGAKGAFQAEEERRPQLY